MTLRRWAAVTLAAIGCANAPAAPPRDSYDLRAAQRPYNVVVISMDAVRYDRTGLGPERHPWTPNLQRLAAESVVFHNASSAAPWTVPSHLAIWTGRWPSHHGVVNKLREDPSTRALVDAALPASVETFPELLVREGFVCAAFTGGAGVSARFGYGRGFHTYLDDRRFAGMDYSLPPAIAWLRAHASERFFLFLHGYDAHGQHPLDDVDPRAVAPDYRGPLDGSVAEQARYREQMLAAIEAPGDAASLRGALTADDGRFLRTVYDRKIEAADRRVGRFLDALRELGLLDRTLVVLLSDHGEEFLEHGALDHGHTLHEEQLHVPLLMRFPRAAGRRDVQAPVRTIDVFPTVFDALGLRGPASVDGQSLMPLVRGQPLDLNLYAETDYRLFVHHRMVRHGRWKLVLDLSDGQMQLFDLEADPGELRDRAADAPDALRPLQADLSRWMSTLATAPAAYRGRRDTPITVY